MAGPKNSLLLLAAILFSGQAGAQQAALPPPHDAQVGRSGDIGLTDSLTQRRPLLGVTTLPVSERMRQAYGLPHRRGAVIVGVDFGSPADAAGVPPGAIVWAIDGHDVNTPDEFADAVTAAGPGGDILITYYDAGRIRRARVHLTGVRREEIPVANNEGVPPPREHANQPDDAARRLKNVEQRLARLEERLGAIERLLLRFLADDSQGENQ